jgi:hypothetical protein
MLNATRHGRKWNLQQVDHLHQMMLTVNLRHFFIALTSLFCCNGGEDAERDDDSKRKQRSEARKRQRAAKKLKEALGLGVEAGDEVVYCRLMLEPLDGSRQTNIGFIRVNSGRVTFLGARAQIMREIESIFLPQTRRVFYSNLGLY